jgi:hypothetical protein
MKARAVASSGLTVGQCEDKDQHRVSHGGMLKTTQQMTRHRPDAGGRCPAAGIAANYQVL